MTQPLIQVLNVTKRFPGVLALDDVSFECRADEVHALCGENGAGKSTLMKILAGIYLPDAGSVLLEGKPVRLHSPHHAQELGISTIYQELNLLPDLTVAENVFLGREPRSRLGFIDKRALETQAQAALQRLGVDIDPRVRLSRLSIAQQQMVEIAKALSLNAKLIIMDEPSASLTSGDLERVFDMIRTLKQQRIGVIYISHRLVEVFEIADRITVMKDGKVVKTVGVGETDQAGLIRMMIGRSLAETFPPRVGTPGQPVLELRHVSSEPRLNDISFSVHSGEIVGIAGLLGAGRTELARLIFGLERLSGGAILVDGQPAHIRRPGDALAHGIGFLTEDRKAEGLILSQSVRRNAALASLQQRQRMGFVQEVSEKTVVAAKVSELNCRTPSLQQEVQYLSGGNQQKVVLAKWLICAPRLLIFDEPTRGIDVGAKSEIWLLMRELARLGTAILMISSELPEVIGMSDRIVVMYKGTVAGILPAADADEEHVMLLATGGAL